MSAVRLKHIFVPDKPRSFRGQRWLNIGLRSVHLVGIAGLAGGYLFGVDEARWLPFGYLALASGIFLTGLYLSSTVLWLAELSGQVIVLKCLLLAFALALPAWRAELFVLVIIVSSIVAHAPGRVRAWCWWRGESLPYMRIKPTHTQQSGRAHPFNIDK